MNKFNPDFPTYVIVDNFYPNPDVVRQYALTSAEYQKTITHEQNWPGLQSTTVELPPMELFESILGEKVKPTPNSGCGNFRITAKKDPCKQLIHFDPNVNQRWAGVCYLSLPEHYTLPSGKIIDAGTKFWRHNKYGCEDALVNIPELRGVGALKNFFETDGLDESKWTEVMNVPIKYNRAVFFRPWLWHSIGKQFGTTRENSRLTHLFFLDKA